MNPDTQDVPVTQIVDCNVTYRQYPRQRWKDCWLIFFGNPAKVNNGDRIRLPIKEETVEIDVREVPFFRFDPGTSAVALILPTESLTKHFADLTDAASRGELRATIISRQ